MDWILLKRPSSVAERQVFGLFPSQEAATAWARSQSIRNYQALPLQVAQPIKPVRSVESMGRKRRLALHIAVRFHEHYGDLRTAHREGEWVILKPWSEEKISEALTTNPDHAMVVYR